MKEIKRNMEDIYPASPVAVARNKSTGNVMSSTSTPSKNCSITAAKNHRHMTAVVDDGDGDPIECTGKSCKSCTAGVVADCVALCCCPCAVIDILTLAFFRIPWTMGRKYLGKSKKSEKKKKKNNNNKKKMIQNKKKEEEMEKSYSYRDCVTYELDSIDGRVSTRSVRDEEIVTGNLKKSLGIVIGEEDKNNTSAKFDVEQFWLDLYEQVGHLGFGRVSYTGIPSQGNTG